MLTKLTYLIHFGSLIRYDLRNGNVDKNLFPLQIQNQIIFSTLGKISS